MAIDVSVTTPPVHITGELSTKRVGAFMKASHKENIIRVQHDGDGFFIADSFAAVRVPAHPDLYPFTVFDPSWERASFREKETTPIEGGADIQLLWGRWLAPECERLTLTHFLYEVPGAAGRTGTLARKFVSYNLQEEKYQTYINKKLCDLLEPGVDELKGFLFETKGFEQPVRVAARNGYVAVLMPMFMKNAEGAYR